MEKQGDYKSYNSVYHPLLGFIPFHFRVTSLCEINLCEEKNKIFPCVKQTVNPISHPVHESVTSLKTGKCHTCIGFRITQFGRTITFGIILFS